MTSGRNRIPFLLGGLFLAAALPLLLVSFFDLARPKVFYLPLALSIVVIALGATFSKKTYQRWQRWTRPSGVRALLSFAIVSCLTIFLCEATLAVADSLLKTPLLAPPSVGSAALIERNRAKPGSKLIDGSRVNSRGFNDTEWEPIKQENTVRVLALGDSFAFGCVGYHENYLTRLEEELSQALSQTCEVINLGLPGMGPPEYRQLLRSEGLAYSPDLILVNFFTGNDFVLDRPRTLFRASDWRLWAVCGRVFRLFRDRWERDGASSLDVPQDTIKTAKALEKREQTPTFSSASYERISQDYLRTLSAKKDLETQRRLDATLEILRQIVQDAGPIPVAIAVLPNEVQVRDDWRRHISKLAGVGYESLNINHPTELLREGLQDLSVTLIDLLPAFREAEQEATTFLPLDSHWNRWGNRVAASTLSQALPSHFKN